MNRFGKMFTFTSFGESHGQAIGCVIDGMPSNIELSESDIQSDLDLRKPGQSLQTTQRKESDTVHIISGTFEGKTTGSPICLLIQNEGAHSGDYSDIKDKFRPSHADLTYFLKYKNRDYRGGGRSSARETAMRVAAGACARKLVKSLLPQSNIDITAKMIKVGNETNPNLFNKIIDKARENNNSVGCVIEIVAKGVPFGLGEPIYDKIDAAIASAMMGINAVKGVEIGDGFDSANSLGSENADEIYTNEYKEIVFKSNHCGGILGGITTGQDIVVRIAVKPTPSISQSLHTITTSLENTSITTHGRHDPCIGPRVIPVAIAMMWCVLADFVLFARANSNN
ncbi:MAG: chorismate synthase [Alphaproteobacteria bacterium]|nr:chorismate synthase [Alphaproteobacteria bacterium]